MARKRKRSAPKEGVTVRGFFRVQITEENELTGEPEVVGDSGWRENLIVNLGFNSFLAGAVAAGPNSSQVKYLALGTGSAPASTDTALPGEVMGGTQRISVTTAFSSTNVHASAILTGTFASGFMNASSTINNLGAYATNTGSNLCAGNTFTASQVNTNQAVNTTYTLTWA